MTTCCWKFRKFCFRTLGLWWLILIIVITLCNCLKRYTFFEWKVLGISNLQFIPSFICFLLFHLFTQPFTHSFIHSFPYFLYLFIGIFKIYYLYFCHWYSGLFPTFRWQMLSGITIVSHRRTSRGGRGGLQPPQLQKFLKYFGQNADDFGQKYSGENTLKCLSKPDLKNTFSDVCLVKAE